MTTRGQTYQLVLIYQLGVWHEYVTSTQYPYLITSTNNTHNGCCHYFPTTLRCFSMRCEPPPTLMGFMELCLHSALHQLQLLAYFAC
jgi:hypothetical protein